MINLNETPSKVLELKKGDLVTVNGIELRVCFGSLTADRLYLTTTDSRCDEYNDLNTQAKFDQEAGRTPKYPHYGDYIKHFRGLDNVAVMERTEMFEALKTGQYTIS